MILAEISEARTASGRLKKGWYEVVLTANDGDLHYLKLSGEELEAIFVAWAASRIERAILERDSGGAQQADAVEAGQGVLAL